MMCAFHYSNCNGFGDMWWRDKCTYFSSRPIDRSNVSLRPREWKFACVERFLENCHLLQVGEF